MGVIDRYYDGAGGSALRTHRKLARDWRLRTFGRRTSLYSWTLLTLAVIAVYEWIPIAWRFEEGLVLGVIGASFLLLPDALMPDDIARWERGAWGEQKTAKVLKSLNPQDWLVRHDLATGYGTANRDHIAVGPAVYLLDSKWREGELWLDKSGLHAHRTGDLDGKEHVDGEVTKYMNGAAWRLKRDLDAAVGFPVAVYPVVVIWGEFAAGVQWDGDVAFVRGDKLAEWLTARKIDLRDERKRAAVRDWLCALPSA